MSARFLERATGFNCAVKVHEVVVTARGKSSCPMPRVDILNAIVLSFLGRSAVDNNFVYESHNNKVLERRSARAAPTLLVSVIKYQNQEQLSVVDL